MESPEKASSKLSRRCKGIILSCVLITLWLGYLVGEAHNERTYTPPVGWGDTEAVSAWMQAERTSPLADLGAISLADCWAGETAR